MARKMTYAEQRKHVKSNTVSHKDVSKELSPESKKAVMRVIGRGKTVKRKPKGSVIKAENEVSQTKINKALKQLDKFQKKNPKKAVLVKDVFAEVFKDLQHLDAFSLKVWAMKNPTAFYTLAAKLIPIQVSGEGGGPITQKVTFS